jgi:hypothetical protein
MADPHAAQICQDCKAGAAADGVMEEKNQKPQRKIRPFFWLAEALIDPFHIVEGTISVVKWIIQQFRPARRKRD